MGRTWSNGYVTESRTSPAAAPGDTTGFQQQVEFAVESDKLKRVLRRNLLMDGSRRENSAEHSWYLGMLALTFADYAPPGTDIDRVVPMVLVHDLVEIDAGDTFAYDPQARATQQEREHKAADRLFALLPGEQAGRLRGLWDEFEERRSNEAKFARALDRIAPLIANHRNEGGTWVTGGVTADRVRARVPVIADGSPRLAEYATALIDDAVARGYLATAAE